MNDVFNLSNLGGLGSINDILELTVNDRLLMLDFLYKKMKDEEKKEEEMINNSRR